MRPRLCFVTLAALLLAGGSCSLNDLTKGKGLSETAVAQFHNQFNAGQYHEIYAQTDEGFKKEASEEDLGTLLEAVRRKLGTVDGSTQAGWHVNATPMGTMVTLSYNVDFSEGKGTEHAAKSVLLKIAGSEKP